MISNDARCKVMTAEGVREYSTDERREIKTECLGNLILLHLSLSLSLSLSPCEERAVAPTRWTSCIPICSPVPGMLRHLFTWNGHSKTKL